MAQITSFAAGPIQFWQPPVEQPVQKLGISHLPIDQSDSLSSDQKCQTIESTGLHRARQAADQARAVAAVVAIATAAAADRAAAFHGTPADGADDHASSSGGGGAGWRRAPQRLTERALLLHCESQSAAGDTHCDFPAERGQRRGSRFVPDALPFHCAADYLSQTGQPGPLGAQRT